MITLHWFSPEDREIMTPLMLEAHRRGLQAELRHYHDPAGDISVHCHGRGDANPARLSAFLLHDVGQDWWASDLTEDDNMWADTPWSQFDLVFLPGPEWSAAWQRLSHLPKARPRLGACEAGWPKADRVGTPEFAAEVAALRGGLTLANRPTVLFAPSWETDDHRNLRSFVAAFEPRDVNLLAKYAPGYHEVEEALLAAHPRLQLIDSTTSILPCLALADAMLSDESNCLSEALLLGVPPVAVTDWEVPAMPEHGLPARPAEPPAFAVAATMATMADTVEALLIDPTGTASRVLAAREATFAHIGAAANRVLDALQWADSGDPRLADLLLSDA